MKKRLLKFTAVFLVLNFGLQIVLPTAVYALTGGPSQPEVQSFQPAGVSDMVDPFSGDFSYNIPLLDVGGYPINMAYASSVSMDDEASWCGLGWNINLGVVNRSVRGIPDDFKGDRVVKNYNVKPNETYGANASTNIQIFGAKAPIGNIGVGIGLSYNTYSGYGFDVNANPSITAAKGSKGSLNVGLGFSASSESGVGVTPNVSYEAKLKDKAKGESSSLTTSIGVPFNSRQGLSSVTIRSGYSTEGNGKWFASKFTDKVGHNGGGQISFATPTYTPSISLPMNSFSISFSATLGTELFGVHGNLEVGGYYSRQALATTNKATPAYGYMYAHESEKMVRGDVMLDFNREKDGSYSKSTPNLPLASHTYDVYSVAGQGVSGSYRLFRGDIGTVFDAYATTSGSSTQLPGIELGGGNAVHVGTNFTFVNSSSHAGRWSGNNDSKNFFAFKPQRAGDKLYESTYFKQVGEKQADSDPGLFSRMGGYEAVRLELGNGNPGVGKASIVNNSNQRTALDPQLSMRHERNRRNQVFAQLTADEASLAGLETQITSYTPNSFSMNQSGGYSSKTVIPRKGQYRAAHHLSEVSVSKTDGSRYIFGIPIYNKVQKEVSFAVSKAADCANGLVGYDPQEASAKNSSGIDNFFDETTTPAYATGYLITAIVSADYVDITGDGPTDDDHGSYTKFNYSRFSDNYQWRVPFQEGYANYSEGLKSNPYDDKGNYLYGEKELWYVHSVETKTQVAEFYLSPRDDGYGVSSERGGIGGQTTQRLDSIALYAKPDRVKEMSGVSPGYKAEPIKKLHFRYDYSLCPGIPNSKTGQGKLTLREVYFTYQRSFKGKFSPYRFTYGSDNPSYNLKGYDRWGNYKPNVQVSACGVEDVTNGEFPYVNQNKELADRYTSSWLLTTVSLPSGGKIKVDFESDDYAYVQDRKAMQMFTIEGIGNGKDSSPISGRNLDDNVFLFFKLKKPISEVSREQASEIVRNDYVGDIIGQQVYFKFFVDLDGRNNYDYVPGYAKIMSSGVAAATGDFRYGYIELKKVAREADKDEGNDENPITKAAWQFARLHRPEIVFGEEEAPGAGNIIGIFKAMVSTGVQILQVVTGLHWYMDQKGYGHDFIPHKSFVRLHNPDGFKYGGGSRVKRISMSDEWAALSNNVDEVTAEYGLEYAYTTTIGQGPSQRTISSGVAGYEPVAGGDENPFRQPIAFTVGKLLAPDTRYYVEEPFGEMFFPGTQVGYSRVVVKNLQFTNVQRNATGSIVHEFYTAKDFPTITRRTSLAASSFKPNFLISFLKVDVKEYMTTSQGYVVELNDMHGKQKAQWYYAEGKSEPISGTEYFYKKSAVQSNRLDNSVYTVSKSPDGNGNFVKSENVGIEYDIIADMREQESKSETSGIGGNLDTFFAAIFPAAIPVVLPNYAKEQTRFRSAVITKVINRYALLERTVVHDLGSKVETKNLLYDAETGEILLTETKNQFNDAIYSFTYPAHWGYEGMGLAYKNIGVVASTAESETQNLLMAGDEVLTNSTYAWIGWVYPGEVYLIDRQGNEVNASSPMKVIRTGRRNQQVKPIGTVASLASPLKDTNGDGAPDRLDFESVPILDASAVKFSSDWKQSCQCTVAGGDSGQGGLINSTNAYILGEAGNWRINRSYTFLTERKQSRLNDTPDLRKDGTFRMFIPFWVAPSSVGYDWSNPYTSENRWTFTSEVTIYSNSGVELENRDALGRYSSAVHGYNQTLPKNVAQNSMLREHGFDGFEDYDHNGCADDHFSFQKFKDNVSEDNAHSGRRSIRVAPNSSIEIRKKFQCPGDEGGGGEAFQIQRSVKQH